jgi:hypothetical protein
LQQEKLAIKRNKRTYILLSLIRAIRDSRQPLLDPRSSAEICGDVLC